MSLSRTNPAAAMFPGGFVRGGDRRVVRRTPAGRDAETITAVVLARDVQLHTADGVRLHARHWDPGVRDLGCVVAHGFTGSSGVAEVVTISRALAAHGFGVLAVDFRGHGRSGGRSTVGADEIRDVAAARRVAARARLPPGRHARLVDGRVGRAAPRRARRRRRRGREHLLAGPLVRARHAADADRALEHRDPHRTARAAAAAPGPAWPAGTGIRCPRRRTRSPGAIAPTPLLIVHGDADHYFPMDHVDLLRAAAPAADGVDRAGHGPRRERHHCGACSTGSREWLRARTQSAAEAS